MDEDRVYNCKESNIDFEAIAKPTGGRIGITNDCNCACTYCYEQQYLNDKSKGIKSISLENMIKLVDIFHNNAIEKNTIPGIRFFGGEPMIKYDEIIVPTINYIRKKYGRDYLLSINTNGLLLNEERIQFLYDNDCKIKVSTDGIKESQNLTRVYKDGTGSYDDLHNILEILGQKYSDKSSVTMTINSQNAKYIYDSIIYFADLGFDSCNLYLNNFDSNISEEILKEQYKLLGEYYISKFRDFEIPIEIKPFGSYLSYPAIITHLTEKNIFHEISLPENGCGLGIHNGLYINYIGDVFSCIHVKNEIENNIFYFGNILNNSVDPLKIKKLIDIRKNDGYVSSKYFDCEKCNIHRICKGDCLPDNYYINGKLASVSKIHCIISNIMYDEALNINKILIQEKNELFRIFVQNKLNQINIHYT